MYDDVSTSYDENKVAYKWSQICEHCREKQNLDDSKLSPTPCDDIICGIKDCFNIAEYYVDL